MANRVAPMVRDEPRHDVWHRWSARQNEIFDELQRIFLAEGFRHLTIADFVEQPALLAAYALQPGAEPRGARARRRGPALSPHGDRGPRPPRGPHDPAEALDEYLRTFTTTPRGASRDFTEDLEAYVPTKHVYDRHLRIALDTLRT